MAASLVLVQLELAGVEAQKELKLVGRMVEDLTVGLASVELVRTEEASQKMGQNFG